MKNKIKMTFDEWKKNKNLSSKSEKILQLIDKDLDSYANDTRRLNSRISYGKYRTSAVILFSKSNYVKLQIKKILFENETINWSKFGFINPSDREHCKKGFKELNITKYSQYNEELKKYLTNVLKKVI